ncbi:MAG: hypothetical protein ACYDG2_01050 [Ruminiclostridium sp.]
MNEDVKREIITVITTYEKASVAAIISGDTSKYTNCSQELLDSMTETISS